MKTFVGSIPRSFLLLTAGLVVLAVRAGAENLPAAVIIGMDGSGHPIHPPADSPASSWTAERPWNGRSVRYNAATDRLAFESYDTEMLAGERLRSELDHGDASRMAGPIAGIVFTAATAARDALNADKTRELYVGEADGSGALCLGCKTLVDGEDGVVMVSAPYANGTGRFVRETGAAIHDVQNKDHAAWHPNGDWITAVVEMPVHSGQHGLACGGTALFNNIWAVYVRRGDPRFGKIWVQLTDWARTWRESGLYDDIAMAPYNASQRLCPAGAQYASGPSDIPFAEYHCSPPGEPPPVSGVMRPTLSESLLPDGNALMAWGATVGFVAKSIAGSAQDFDEKFGVAGPLHFNEKLGIGGPLLLGRAELHLADAGIAGVDLKLPALVKVQCPLAPSQAHPDGIDTYKGRQYPGKLLPGSVGQLYEAWAFSPDNTHLLLASDVFASGRPGPGRISKQTVAFMDVVDYATDGSGITDLTAYNPSIGYGYELNGWPPPLNTWGYWEEPAVYITWRGRHYIAFGSSAGYPKGGGICTWLFDVDHPKVKRITGTGDPTVREVSYPTSYNAERGVLYVTGEPAPFYKEYARKDPTGYGGYLSPLNQRVMRLGEALDNGLMK